METRSPWPHEVFALYGITVSYNEGGGHDQFPKIMRIANYLRRIRPTEHEITLLGERMRERLKALHIPYKEIDFS